MKKMLILAILFLTVSASAYCQMGTQINREYVRGGYLVTYSFGSGQLLSFKFQSGQSIPYSIRFDFDRWEICL